MKKSIVASLLLTAVFTSMIVSTANAWLTPGYWKTHFEEWETATVNWRGIVSSNAEAYGWLWTPPRGDASIILARALIAAILNLDVAGHTGGEALVAAAASHLVTVGIGTNPSGSGRAMCIAYAEQLDNLNNDLPWTMP